MDKGDQAAAESQERLRIAIVTRLERSKTIVDDRIEELEEEVTKVICDPLLLKATSEQLFNWYNEPPAPPEDQKQLAACCVYKAVFLPVLRWTCLRLFRSDLELTLKELEKDLQELDMARIDHHKREAQALVVHCWCLLVQGFDPVSEAVESAAFRGGQYTGEPFWIDLEAMDQAELQSADLTAWAMVQMRPWAPIGDEVNQVVGQFVGHLQFDPDERERFYSPDVLDLLKLLVIADSSLKVATLLLQRFRPTGQTLTPCTQSDCGLHGFQRSWMIARGRSGGAEACGAIPKVQHIIASTLSDNVASVSTGPGQRSQKDIAHEAMKGLKRLFRDAGIQGRVAQEAVKLLKDLSKTRHTEIVKSDDRASDHSSERVVTVSSDPQEHVSYTLEDSVESSAIENAVSTNIEREQERSNAEEGAAAKKSRQGSDKENQSLGTDRIDAHAPNAGIVGGELTLGQVTSPKTQRPRRSQMDRPPHVAAAIPSPCSQSVPVRAAVAGQSTTQLKVPQPPSVHHQKNRRGMSSLSSLAPEMPPRKMIFDNRELLMIWRHIFPKRGSKDKRVEVEWTAFERVMQSSPLNFKMEKPSGNGSARTFVRVDPERGQESITLHRPHGSMVPIQYLRNWQRRFRRSLGMEAEDFVGPE